MFHLIFDLVKYLHLFYSLFLELEERDLTRTLRYDFFYRVTKYMYMYWSEVSGPNSLSRTYERIVFTTFRKHA